MASPQPADTPLPLSRVLREEYAALRPEWQEELAAAVSVPDEADEAARLARLFAIVHGRSQREGGSVDGRAQRPLAALCCSGGGIRSATFHLGILQGLARIGLLQRFDYLSSVSGGGFISGWLARWMHGCGGDCAQVVAQLDRPADDPRRPEPAPLSYLRRYSNYLTPRLGALSADSWTTVAIVLRNVVLNALVLLPVLAAALLVPLLAVCRLPAWLSFPAGTLFATACGLVLVSGFFVNLLRGADSDSPPWTQRFLLFGLLPLLAAVPLLLQAVYQALADDPAFFARAGAWRFTAVWALGAPLAALALAVLLQKPLLGRRVTSFAWDSGSLLIVGGVEILLYQNVAAAWLPGLLGRFPLYAVLGPGLVLGPMFLGRILIIGLSSLREMAQTAGRGDADREWWSRWLAWGLICKVVWFAASALVLYAPTLLATTAAKLGALLGAGGLGAVAAKLGQSALPKKADGGKSASPATRLFLAAATPLAVVALALVLARAGQEVLRHVAPEPAAAVHTASGWTFVAPYSGALHTVALAVALLLLFGFLVGWPFNVNRFSMQEAYRNRLIRAYLGASHGGRKPNPFTGFDAADDLPLADLAANRPLPVLNLTLNLVHGAELAWQERKAQGFTATPLHCGSADLGYRPSAEYGGLGGLSLGTAVATSGAASSPNMGLYSSPALTFLMTLFDLRLGIWLGNPGPPGRTTYRRGGPRSSARIAFDEAFGLTDACHPYVNLSDGGHFENFGLYEMVRRRCRTIVVGDAGADPSYAFADLGNAIRKIRIDLGIPIAFEKRVEIRGRAADGTPAAGTRYCAVASIHYDRVDPGAAPGTLVYVKPALPRDPSPPMDVDNYAATEPAFPHESTADQWFSGSQFESYRALGEAAIRAMARSETSFAGFDP
ncbi:MAG TPA: patatin-like phospholipase family protein, partial [Thermoanaerobaculia bacterium]